MAETTVTKPKKNLLSTKDMVVAALKATRHGHQGVGMASIKKYILQNYTVSEHMLQTNLRKALTKGMLEGLVVKPNGVGLSGSFKLNYKAAADYEKEATRKKKPQPKKKTAAKADGKSTPKTSATASKKPKKTATTPSKTAKPKVKAAKVAATKDGKKQKPKKTAATTNKPKAKAAKTAAAKDEQTAAKSAA